MNIKFLNAEKIIDGIGILSEDLGFNYTMSENADVTISLKEIAEDKLIVTKKGNDIEISFKEKARFFRGLAYAIDWVKQGIDKEISETPLFTTNGTMFDMSRNGVMNVKSIKLVFRKMALMGLNTFLLYTEDTYEIEGYPYFGHLRGRYTKDEMKELDAYAVKLGIEIIPCIQTLGHLSTHLIWPEAGKYKDGASTLFVGSEETNKLIDAMFKTIKECFSSKRVHVGMDETFDLGTGAYLETKGYRPREEIFFEQMEIVREIAKKYDLKPMMWSDMIFRLAGKNIKPYFDYHRDVVFTPEVIAKIPKGVQPVFWDYYNDDQTWYDTNVEKHQAVFDEEFMFAGGVWIWSGHCPLYSVSFSKTLAALNSMKEHNAKEVIATVWHNGSEGSHIMSLAGLAWYASFDYCGGYDLENMKETFRISCNGSYDDMMLFEKPEQAVKGSETCSRALLYSDPLLGIFDYHFSPSREHYESVTEILKNAKVSDIFKPATDMMIALSEALIYKGDFGLRLTEAYRKGDKETLKNLIDECDIIAEKVLALKKAHRASWFEYNKTFGWEVHDTRYGGLISRLDTVKLMITQYLNGEIDRIEELEQERLSYIPGREERILHTFRWARYGKFVTVGDRL